MENKLLDYKIDGDVIKLIVAGNEIYPGMDADNLEELEGFERSVVNNNITFLKEEDGFEREVEISLDSDNKVCEVCSNLTKGEKTERIRVNQGFFFYNVLADSIEIDIEIIKTDDKRAEPNYMQIVASRGIGENKEWIKYKTDYRDELEIVCNGYAESEEGELNPIEKTVSTAFEKGHLNYSLGLDEYIYDSESFSTVFDLDNASDLSIEAKPTLINTANMDIVVKEFYPSQFKMLGFKDTGYLKDGERKFLDACSNGVKDTFGSAANPEGFITYFEQRIPSGSFEQSIVSINSFSKLKKRVLETRGNKTKKMGVR